MRTGRLGRFGSWRLWLALAVMGSLLLASVAANAQSYTGSISGTVTDTSGAVVPDAKITLTNTATKVTRTATSGASGVYNFAALPPGEYKLAVEAKNFGKQEKRAIVTVAQDLKVDIALGTATVTETVTVAGGAVAVNTEDAQLSNVVSGKQLDLPLLTRDVYDLVQLSSGANDGPDKDTGYQRGTGMAINGQRSQSGNFMLDGGENNDTFIAGVGQSVPADAVQEFRVQTNNYTAEFGRSSGYVANVITKSGTNAFHGSLYEYNRNSEFAAKDAYTNAIGDPRPFFNRNQFGGSIGGPVIKDKTFFFFSTEWLKIRSSTPVGYFVPTPELLGAVDPGTTGTMFTKYPAPTIPAGAQTLNATDLGLTGLTSALGSSMGGAAIPDTMPLFGRVVVPTPQDAGAGIPGDSLMLVSKIDHHFTDKTTLTGRYAYYREADQMGTVSHSPYAGFNTDNFARNQNLGLTLTHVWSPSVVTEHRFVWNRLLNNQPIGDNPLGQSLYLYDIAASQSNGAIVLPGYTATPDMYGSAIPFGGPQNEAQVYNSVSWQKGKHSLKFGGQWVHIQDNRTFGAYSYALAMLGRGANNDVQDLINGTISDYSLAVDPQGNFPTDGLPSTYGPPRFDRHDRYNEVSFFGLDSWRVTPRLTLNAGLRWEYFGPLHSMSSESYLDSNFYFGPGSNYLEQIANGGFNYANAQPGDMYGKLYRANWGNIAPRFGFAYDLTGKGTTVVRGGFGVFYDRNFGNVLFNVFMNPPNFAIVRAGSKVGTPDVSISLDQYAALQGAVLPGTYYSASARALDPNMRTAYANEWNFGVQHDFSNVGVVDLTYVGSMGVHLYSMNNINRLGSQILIDPGCVSTSCGALNPNISTPLTLRSNSAQSSYHSLQVGLKSRYIKSAGMQFLANYTWSHSIDNASSTFGDSYLLSYYGLTGFQDAFNPKGDLGASDFDVRHRFVTSFNWDIPFARNTKGVMNYILDGWSWNGMLTFRTGYPFSVYDILGADNYSEPVRPTLIGSMPSTHTGGYLGGGVWGYLPFDNFGPGPSVNGPFIGAIGRNTFRAPGMQTWNMSFFKTFKIAEGKNLQFRGELYNIFNHPNMFVFPGSNFLGLSDQVTAMKGGTPTTTGNVEQHRNIQFALRFNF